MADYYASIFGTEKDKVNCSFYFKIGACRHGDRCSRVHNRPSFSQTVLIQNLYVNPTNEARSEGRELTEEEDQKHFDQFFEDIFVELEEKFGPIEEMNVCDNLGDHLIGNVYVKFKHEEDAEKAVEDLNKRWFGGKPIYAELSTVSDFREAGCRQYEIGACTRGGFCNFMHLKQISDELRRHLFGSSKGGGGSRHRSRRSQRSSHISRNSRSRSPLSRSPRTPRSRSRSSSLVRHRSPSYNRKKSSRRRRRRRHSKRPRSPPSRSRSRSISRIYDDDVEGPALPPLGESRLLPPGARSPRSRSNSPASRRRDRAPIPTRSRSRSLSPSAKKQSNNNYNSNNNEIISR